MQYRYPTLISSRYGYAYYLRCHWLSKQAIKFTLYMKIVKHKGIKFSVIQCVRLDRDVNKCPWNLTGIFLEVYLLLWESTKNWRRHYYELISDSVSSKKSPYDKQHQQKHTKLWNFGNVLLFQKYSYITREL